MLIAVIGSTGFVGSNLVSQIGDVEGYNSNNIADIDGKMFDLVICAGARAEKWKINQDPESDIASLRDLMNHLSTIEANKFVLISTVDAYPSPVDVDEDTPIDATSAQPYGKHRVELEKFCSQRFDTTIVRLPGLFGTGIKKNIMYDFLHDNNLDQIHADGSFQFYSLDHLWLDIKKAMGANLKLVNFATEPTSVAEVARTAFGLNFDNRPKGKTAASYDFKTKYADVFGGSNGYIADKTKVLADMKAFVERERKSI